jgi:hypothetical protein
MRIMFWCPGRKFWVRPRATLGGTSAATVFRTVDRRQPCCRCAADAASRCVRLDVDQPARSLRAFCRGPSRPRGPGAENRRPGPRWRPPVAGGGARDGIKSHARPWRRLSHEAARSGTRLGIAGSALREEESGGLVSLSSTTICRAGPCRRYYISWSHGIGPTRENIFNVPVWNGGTLKHSPRPNVSRKAKRDFVRRPRPPRVVPRVVRVRRLTRVHDTIEIIGEAGILVYAKGVADSPTAGGGDLVVDKPKDQPKPWQPGGGQQKPGPPQPGSPKK